MKRLASILVAVGLVAISLAAPGAAQAQFGPGFPGAPTGPLPGGYGSAAVSPYLNLVQRGFSPAITYYGIVRPQINLQNAVQGLQFQQLMGAGAPSSVASDQYTNGIPYSGHTSTFMNYSHYFGGASGVGGTGLNLGFSRLNRGNSNRMSGQQQGSSGMSGGQSGAVPSVGRGR
jgi:hypothetical protein